MSVRSPKLVVAACLFLAGCTTADPARPSDAQQASPTDVTSPTPTAGPVADASIGLHLFSDGKVVKIVDGVEDVVARWPTRTAPYVAPVETRHGFVGLAGRPEWDLWLVDRHDRAKLAEGVGQGFAVAAGGDRVAYAQTGGADNSRLVVAELPSGEVLYSMRPSSWAEPVGFIGDRVLLEGPYVGDRASIWDPAAGSIEPLGDVEAAVTDPTARRAVLHQGDGLCWDLATFADKITRIRGRGCDLATGAFAADGRWFAAVHGTDFGPRNRVETFSVFDGEPFYRSEALPGAMQAAWYRSTLFVFAWDEARDYKLYRCLPDRPRRACDPLWTGSGPRYATWLIPRATRPLRIARDEGRGFAMWPEHTGADAARACAAPAPYRADPRSTAEEFGRQVLGWSDARAEIVSYDHFAVRAVLRRGDGPRVVVYLTPVARGCWSVTGVGRPPDRRPTGVSASVRGRQVQVGVLSLGAESADVIVGFDGREIRRDGLARSGVQLRLDFKPKGSGYFIVLLRAADGRVFSAAGALLHPGLVAG